MPFFTAFLDIQVQNTCIYGCLNLPLYIFIRNINLMAFRFLLFFHCTYNGASLLIFSLNRYPCRRAFWDLLFTNIYDLDTRLAWIDQQLIPPGYFVMNPESDFAHISTTGSLTDGSMNLSSRNEGFLMVPKFP